jgi:hypothetical protein
MIAPWVEKEFKTLKLKDARLTKRTKKLVTKLAANPEASIPVACGSDAEVDAAYRYLSSLKVEVKELRAAHAAATLERARGLPYILLAQDTTELSFSGRATLQGIGPLDRNGQGLKVHTGLALSPEGVPLGILHQEVWARSAEEKGKRHQRRKRAAQDKESAKWRRMGEHCQALLPERMGMVQIGDSEADCFFFLAMERQPGVEILIRATQDRRLASPEELRLWEAVVSAPLLGSRVLRLPRTPTRPERDAHLEIRAIRVKLSPPRHERGRAQLKPVEATAILVQEVGEVPQGQEPVQWLLLTTLPVESFEDAWRVVQMYTQRWKAERYHYTLKSGCKIEELQLEAADRIERALALYSVVAWRLLYLTYEARAAPDAPCTRVLEEDEWQVLLLVRFPDRPLPARPPSLREAMRMMAGLGGFLGRKSDGEPGVKTLWRGYRRLMDYVVAFRATRKLMGNA